MKHYSIFFLFLIYFINIQAQTQIKIPDTLCCPEREIQLPVYAENLVNAGAITIFLTYDTNNTEFLSLENKHPQLSDLMFHNENNTLGIAWHSAAGISVEGGRLFDILLNYHEGITEFTFTDQCEIAGTNLDIFPVEFMHGTIFPSDSISQEFSFVKGWNSFSLYLEPYTSDPEILFSPILSSIDIITDGLNFFYPPGNINTIGAINHTKGYAIKTNSAITFSISGCTASEKVIQVPQGWSYLVVPVRCEVSTADLAAAYSAEIRIIRALIGTGVYWPEREISSLNTMQPGNAYLINAWTGFDLVFPVCE